MSSQETVMAVESLLSHFVLVCVKAYNDPAIFVRPRTAGWMNGDRRSKAETVLSEIEGLSDAWMCEAINECRSDSVAGERTIEAIFKAKQLIGGHIAVARKLTSLDVYAVENRSHLERLTEQFDNTGSLINDSINALKPLTKPPSITRGKDAGNLAIHQLAKTDVRQNDGLPAKEAKKTRARPSNKKSNQSRKVEPTKREVLRAPKKAKRNGITGRQKR